MPIRVLKNRNYLPPSYFLRRDMTRLNWMDPIEERRLITLTHDRNSKNRDWAVFYLNQANNDSDALRKALRRAALDSHEDTVAEARLGLAKWNDPHALGLVRKSLNRPVIGILDIRAAGWLAHGSLVPLLERHIDWEFARDEIEQAIRSCRTRNRANVDFS